MHTQTLRTLRINGVEISEQAIAAEMQYHPAATAEQARESASTALAVRELLLQEASRQGCDGEPDDMIDQLLAQALNLPQAGEQECRQYYAANPQRFLSPTLLEARHILLPAAPDDADARQQALEKARTLIATLQQNVATFDELARDHSVCPSREQGGSLGQLSKGSTVPEFERQVFAAEPGLMTQPVETRYGYHVVQVERKIPGERLPYENVRDQVRHYLEQKVFNTALSQYLRLLTADATIEGIALEAAASPLLQ